MTITLTPISIPPDLSAAHDALNAALAAREALDGLVTKSATDAAAATAELPGIKKEIDRLTVEIASAGAGAAVVEQLGQPLDKAALPILRRQLAAAQKARDSAEDTIARAATLERGVEAKNDQVDAAIEAAGSRFRDALTAHRSAVAALLRADLVSVALDLVQVLRRANALRWTIPGANIGGLVDDIVVPDPVRGSRYLITGNRFFLASDDETWNNLAETWRSDPDAASVGRAHQPIADASRQLDDNLRKIAGRRERQRIASNAERQSGYRKAPTPYRGLPPAAAPAPTPNPALGSARNIWRTPGTPAPKTVDAANVSGAHPQRLEVIHGDNPQPSEAVR